MSRYIDFYLIGEFVDSHGNVHYEDLKNLPTADVVEVVRCCDADKGDCMFNHWHETPNGEKYHICNLNQLSFSEHADFFCAYGERREDDKG